MEPIRISRDLTFQKYIAIIFITISLLIFFLFLVLELMFDFFNENYKLAPLVFFFCSLLFFLIVNSTSIVEFDDKNMYIKKYEKIEIVPLKNIKKIKLTLTTLNERNLWKISYLDKKGVVKNIRMIPRIWYQNFSKFKKEVQNSNHNVEIINWSHSFDIDQ